MASKGFGKVSIIRMIEHMTRLEVDQLERYLRELSQALSDRSAALAQEVEAAAQKLDEAERDEYYSWHEDEHWELADVFPNLLRNSMFVACFSFFERTMREICKVVSREHPKQIGFSEIAKFRRGSGDELGFYNSFLKDIHGINVPNQSKEWQKITFYRTIRNFIAHHEGRLDDSEKAKKIREYAAANKDMKVDQFGRIELTEPFCIEALQTIGAFLELLFKEIQN